MQVVKLTLNGKKIWEPNLVRHAEEILAHVVNGDATGEARELAEQLRRADGSWPVWVGANIATDKLGTIQRLSIITVI
jgi:hypothetical protein